MLDQDSRREAGTKLRALTEQIARTLVKYPDQVQVKEIGDNTILIYLVLRVDVVDMGRIIGKKGRTADAMRTLLRASAAQAGQRVRLEIIQP